MLDLAGADSRVLLLSLSLNSPDVLTRDFRDRCQTTVHQICEELGRRFSTNIGVKSNEALHSLHWIRFEPFWQSVCQDLCCLYLSVAVLGCGSFTVFSSELDQREM